MHPSIPLMISSAVCSSLACLFPVLPRIITSTLDRFPGVRSSPYKFIEGSS